MKLSNYQTISRMRRILNLNGPGMVFVKLIGLFGLLIPAALFASLLLLKQPEAASLVRSAIRISLAIGVFVLVILVALVVVEQIQDRRFDAQYRKNRRHRLALPDGSFECQYCGNRQLKERDAICPVCGKEQVSMGKHGAL